MKTVTVAFVLHKKIDKIYKEITKKLSRLLSALIEEENAETFLFTGNNAFDCICYDILTELKRYYPLIKRVRVSPSARETDEAYQLLNFEELFIPEKSTGYNRYRTMVDKCDILVTYFDKDYKLLKGRAEGTKNSVEYALEQNKRIINLAE